MGPVLTLPCRHTALKVKSPCARKPRGFTQEFGAGEGNRTLDIQLGKLDGSQANQTDAYKTEPYRRPSASNDYRRLAILRLVSTASRLWHGEWYPRREWPQAIVSLLQKQIAAIVRMPDVKRLLEFLGRLRRLR